VERGGVSSAQLLIPLLSGLVIPILVGVATKLDSATGIKRIVAFFLSAVVGVLTGFVASGADTFDWVAAGLGAVVAFGTNVAVYYDVYRRNPPLKAATAAFGLGTPSAPIRRSSVLDGDDNDAPGPTF
jgi:hypothetical protein